MMAGKQACNVKKLLMTLSATFALLFSYGANISSTGAGGNWNSAASWSPAQVPVAGDNVTIVSGSPITVTAGAAATTVTINSGGVLTLNGGNLTVSTTFTVNGTLDCNTTYIVNGACNFTLANSNAAVLKIGNANGITSAGNASGSIQNTGGTRSFGANATYHYTGNNNQVTGNGLPPSIGALVVNNTGTSPNNVVSLTTSPLEIKANPATGILTLTLGVFKIGSGNVLNFNNNSSTNGLTNNGGDLATTGTNGIDGGKVVLLTGSGANFNISGTGVTHFYDLSFGTAVGAANRQVVQNTANKVVINGTLTMQDNQSKWATNSPIYSATATLYVNNNGQGYTPGAGTRLEWMAMSSGTIGTTAGFPNNVILVNMGNSQNNGCGFGPSGSWTINGTFSIGDGTVAGLATLQSMTAFICTGLTIDNNSTLKHATETFTVRGNWRQQGATIGIFAPTTVSSSSPVIFGGSGTPVSPQTISASTGTLTFGNGTNSSGITIANGAYVKLNSPVTLQSANIFTLVNGILETSSTNILYIKNTAVTGITGSGSSTTYINGPVKWDIALASKYTLPLGKSTSYLPFDITPAAAASNTITAEAFNVNSNGAPDGTTVTAISNTEYWSLTATSTFVSGASISAARTAGNGSNNMLAKSTTASGVYSAIGGSTGTVGSITGVSTSGTIGSSSPWFFVLAYGPLNINVVSITYPGCNGTGGAVTVAGSGGTTPYTYNLNAGTYQASGTFSGLAAGTYTFGVKDNVGATKTISVNLQALAATSDTGTCAGGSIQLQANSLPAWGYTWSPTTGLSSSTIANPVATPGVTTTYTVSAIIVNETTNLISNPGFESGNTGFTSSYIYHVCGPYASSWSPAPPAPCDTYGQFHNGIYKVRKNAQDLCTNLTNFNARTGDSMLVVDGPNSATYTSAPFWSQSLSGLATNTNYVFTYWVRQAFNGAGSYSVVRTDINGSTVTGTATYPNPYTASSSSWTQMSYLWNSGASTTATIAMYDQTVADAANDFAIDDMSFYITCQPTATVTVAITTTPTLNTLAQPLQACAGSGASINLTGLTAVDTFTVNYTINGVSQTPVTGVISDGSGNASFTSAVLSALNNGQVLQVTSLTNTGGHSNCSQTFSGKTVTLTVNAPGTWLGTTSTDWNTASNWCGGVPTTTTDVLIPDYGIGGTYPVINASVSGTCKNITISSNASVIINTNGSLAASGTYSSNGTFTNNGEFIFNSSSVAQSFPGATGTVSTMNNFTINNTSGLGVTFNRDFSIYGALTPTAGLVNVNNALVTLTSTATTNARVGVVGVASGFTYTGTGEFAVERYYPQRRSWRLVTAPLTATGDIFDNWQLSGAAYGAGNVGRGLLITGPTATSPIGPDGLDISQQQNPSLKKGISLTPVSNTHVPLSKNLSTSADNIGYFLFVRGDRDPNNTIIPYMNNTTVTSKGKLQTGPQLFAGSSTANGLELVGNPYASPVSFKTLIRNNLNNRFYAWDPALNAQGGWVTIDDIANSGSYTKSPTSPGGLDSLIQSCQAIVIETATNGPSSITFNEADKGTQNSLGMFRPTGILTSQPKSIRTNLYIINPDNSATLADGNLVQFDERFTNAVTNEDAAKFFNIHETFFLLRDNQSLSIERRKINQYDTVFFKLAKFQQRKYRFELITERFAGTNAVAFLDDNFNHSSTPLDFRGVTVVNFEINANPASAAPDRFKIIFKPAFRIVQIHTLTVNQNVQVEWRVNGEHNVDHYETERSVDGINYFLISTKQSAGDTESEVIYSNMDVVPSAGDYYYRIKGIDKSGTEVYSEVSKVKVIKTKTGITVYPNPVSGTTISLLMNNMPDGRYSAVLINTDGQELKISAINHKNENVVETVQVNDILTKGTYHLKITGPGNYNTTLKVLY